MTGYLPIDGADGGFPDGAFEGNRALTVQSYVEANSKIGVQHEGSALFTAVPALGINDTIFLTGSKPVALKGRVVSYSGEGVVAEVYSGATYTGGTEADYQNASDINPVVGESKIIVGATIVTDGSLNFAPIYSLGNKSNQGQGSTLSVLGSERLLKPNTPYLLRLASLDSAVQDISSFLTWYEGDLDLPQP